MIGWLDGVLRGRDAEGRLIVNVGGVGYLVQVPLSDFGQHGLGDRIELWIHTHVREDQITLYGFEGEDALQTYRALTTVTGVGPKVALSILSDLSPPALAQAVQAEDLATLSIPKGVGKRLATRLALELQGKLDFLQASLSQGAAAPVGGSTRSALWRDVESALAHLGYRQKEIEGALQLVKEKMGTAEVDIDAAVREALAALRR